MLMNDVFINKNLAGKMKHIKFSLFCLLFLFLFFFLWVGGEEMLINSKKGTCYLVDFAVPKGHVLKMKENENTVKMSMAESWTIMEIKVDGDISCRLKTWNSSLSLEKETLEMEIRGRTATIQSTAKSQLKHLKESWRPEEIWSHSNLKKRYWLKLVGQNHIDWKIIIVIWPYEQMVYAQPSSGPGEWHI